MALALIISSHVAASRVGGFAQALVLAPFRIDPMIVPTVLYGRHPGWGGPGGGAVSIETFEGMLEGVAANDLFGLVEVVITGYFATGDQVRAAARTIDAVRAASREGALTPRARVIVDPTLGDAAKGLYVSPEVARAVAAEFIPRADFVAPNAWELQHLTGAPVDDPISAVHAARLLGTPTLVSSVMAGEEIGAVYADPAQAWFAGHAKRPGAPKGTGDVLTALFAAWLVEGESPPGALFRAMGGVSRLVGAARDWKASELPIVGLGAGIKDPPADVRLERLV